MDLATVWQRNEGKPNSHHRGGSAVLPEGDLWVYGTDAKPKGRGAAFYEPKKAIRRAALTARLVVGDIARPAPRDHPLLSALLPLEKKRKPRRTGKRAGPRFKVAPEKIRALKRLGRTDAQIVEAYRSQGITISRWTVARHTK